MEQPWVPTHVQVTVLRGRGLRGKGKHGTSDVYVVIQLAKEKYSTCVAEKTTEPEWREECCFELQPGVMEMDTGPELVLTVMHRAVIGLDVFLGQAVIQLRKLFHESRGVKNHWYRLNSKTGKKEKERGDIQVSVQFTRNNLTASMYDLVMKDKGGASTFSKLKERMRGKRRSSEDDSTLAPPGTTVPGGTGPLCRVRQRLPSDGGGEEDYEDDEGGEVRRSKMRTFFLRGKLRKSSDTRSSTSLGSESSESSRGGSLSPTAGISVVVSDLSNSPSNSSNLTADSPEHIADTSPKLSPLRCDFSDDFNEITIAVPQLPVGVNETHKPQPRRDQASAAPEASLGLGHLQKTLPLSVSLQNLRPRPSAEPLHGTVGDGRRWSFDKAGEEESAAIAAAMEKNCPVLGREDQCEEAEEHSGTDAKHKGWFGSKESHSKPSSRPPIEQLFPKASHPVNQTWDSQTNDHIVGLARASPTMSMGKTIPLSKKSSNPFTTAEEQEPNTEWDDCFEEFAACRLQEPKDQTSDSLASAHERELDERNDFLNTKGVTLSNYMANCGHPHSLDPIPEDVSFEYCNKVSSESQPPSEWHQANSTDPTGSSGIGSSVEDDFLSCFSSYSASDKFSACSSDEIEPQTFQSVVPDLEISFKTTISPKGGSSADELLTEAAVIQSEDSEWSNSEGSIVFTPPPTMPTAMMTGLEAADLQTPENVGLQPDSNMSLQSDYNNEGLPQQTVIQSEDSEWWDSEGSLVFTPPPTISTAMMTGLEAADMQTPENLDVQPLSNTSQSATSFLENLDGNLLFHQNQYDLSETPNLEKCTSFGEPGQIPEFASVTVSQKGSTEEPSNHNVCLSLVTADGPDTFEPGFTAGDDGSSEVLPVTHTGSYQKPAGGDQSTDLGDVFLRNPSPQLAKISQRTRSFLQSLGSNLQYHQNDDSVFESTERVDSEKSIFCGEVGEISESTTISVSPGVFTTGPNNETYSSLVAENRSDTCEPGFTDPCDLGFTARIDGSSEVLPVTPTDSYSNALEGDQFTVLDDVFVNKPLPEIPETFQNTMSSLQSLDGNRHHDISTPPEWVVSKNSTDCGELGEIPNTASASVIPEVSLDDPKKQADWLSLVTESRPNPHEPGFTDTRESSFTAGADGSSQVLPAISTASYPEPIRADQFTAFDDMFVAKPPPRLPKIFQRTMSVPSCLLSRNHQGVSKPTEARGSANSTYYGEVEESPEAAFASVRRRASTSGPNINTHITDWLSLVMKDKLDAGFTGEDNKSSQVLDATSTDLNPDEVLDDMMVKQPAPPHLALHRTQSESTLPFDLDKTLPLSFWNEYCAVKPLSTPPASPSLSIVSAPPLTRQSSCFPSFLSSFSDASLPPATLNPQEAQECWQQHAARQELSPHPVRPLGRGTLSEGRSVLDKIKSSIHPGRSSQTSEKILTEGAGSYYHLTHSELIGLLVRREAELERQKAEFQQQRALLAKREVELRKLKPQVRDLEDYIDTLLVRIMEQKPTLLQVRSRLK
ncbi:uncharacterized protein rab11fip5a isoform X2 [Vanacampus margaritifer]